ncbi:MAG: hypothetical protein EOP05_05850 [Proteobacteria bacterium]|nr:MAG: hypothetical protein EOP05_05850 [Pseudomonadota bacterium]
MAGESELLTLNDGAQTIVVPVDQKTKKSASVSFIDASGTTTHSRNAEGVETIVQQTDHDGMVARSVFVVNESRTAADLVSLTTTPELLAKKPASGFQEVAPTSNCSSKLVSEEIATAKKNLEQLSSDELLNYFKSVSGCAENTERIVKAHAAVLSKNGEANSLTCVSRFPRFKDAADSAIAMMTNPGREQFVCSADEPSKMSGWKITFGNDFLQEHNDLKAKAKFFDLLMTGTISSQDARSVLQQCCVGGVDAQRACAFLEWSKEESVSQNRRVFELLRKASFSGVSRSKLTKLNKDINTILGKYRAADFENADTLSKVHASIVKACGKAASKQVCAQYSLADVSNNVEMSTAMTSANPTRAEIGAIKANPQASETPDSKSLPPVAQKLSYNKNDQASVRQAMNRYQYMGPLASSVRKVAASVSAQLGNEAYAATTGAQDSGAGVSGGDSGFQSTPVKFDSAGNTISRINVNGKNVYVKASIPFSDTKIGEPSVSMGSSIGSMAPVPVPTGGASVAKQKLAKGQSQAADSAGASGGGDFAPGVVKSSLAGNAGAATSPTSTPQRQAGGSSGSGVATGNARAVSSASPSYETVGKFNRALLEANDPRDFLRNAEPSLEQLKIQVVLNGARREMYPPKPTYRPTRIIDYNELKRAMRK